MKVGKFNFAAVIILSPADIRFNQGIIVTDELK